MPSAAAPAAICAAAQASLADGRSRVHLSWHLPCGGVGRAAGAGEPLPGAVHHQPPRARARPGRARLLRHPLGERAVGRGAGARGLTSPAAAANGPSPAATTAAGPRRQRVATPCPLAAAAPQVHQMEGVARGGTPLGTLVSNNHFLQLTDANTVRACAHPPAPPCAGGAAGRTWQLLCGGRWSGALTQKLEGGTSAWRAVPPHRSLRQPHVYAVVPPGATNPRAGAAQVEAAV